MNPSARTLKQLVDWFVQQPQVSQYLSDKDQIIIRLNDQFILKKDEIESSTIDSLLLPFFASSKLIVVDVFLKEQMLENLGDLESIETLGNRRGTVVEAIAYPEDGEEEKN